MTELVAGALPLLNTPSLDAPVAWRAGVPVSAGEFLADVAQQAELLPAHGPMVNLCLDRYRFAVGLAAALARGHTSLLPPNALPDTLARLRGPYPALYGLCDDPALTSAPPLALVEPPTRPPDAGAPAALPQIDTALPAVCLLTSGSTGDPQPHVKRWGPLVVNIRTAARRLAEVLQRPTLAGLTLVATVPPQHSYGLESGVLLAWLGGCAFEGSRPYFPADIVQALASVPRPRALVTTPFHLKTLLLSGLSPPAVDLMISATAPLSPQLAALAEQALGGPLLEIYGCTEAGQVAARRTTASDVWQTFGELRLHREVLQGEERFIVRGGHVTEPTPLADVLQLLDERRFRLLGRATDLIHVAGKRSSLSHLNYHLNSIEGVADGAFWLPEQVPDGVVRPVAFVVAPTLSAAQIIAALRRRLEPAFVPRRVIQVAALPREATGKLTAQSLQSFAREQLAGGGG